MKKLGIGIRNLEIESLLCVQEKIATESRSHRVFLGIFSVTLWLGGRESCLPQVGLSELGN
jgi:hypothetical protein